MCRGDFLPNLPIPESFIEEPSAIRHRCDNHPSTSKAIMAPISLVATSVSSLPGNMATRFTSTGNLSKSSSLEPSARADFAFGVAVMFVLGGK